MSSASLINQTTGAQELVSRARELFPFYRERAKQADDARHLTADMVEAFEKAEFATALVPRRWGGRELEFTDVVNIVMELGRASGSMGWVGSFWLDHPHWVALYPEEAQAEVWAAGPNVRVATSYVPVGRVTPVDGGWLLSGEWAWASGVGHSSWVLLGGMAPQGPDQPPQNRLFMVPTHEITVVDTWFSAGLRGTGSDNVVAESVFVPEHRTLVMETVREGVAPGALAHPRPILTAPLMTHAGFAMIAPALGIARGVIEEWVSNARVKAHSYTREQVAAAIPMQLRLADSSARVDCAELTVRHCLERVQSGEPLTLEDRVRNRRDISFAMLLVTRAVQDLMQMAGASALRDESPIQRGWRDVSAVSSHVMLNFNAAAENYGRMELGLPLNPKDPFF